MPVTPIRATATEWASGYVSAAKIRVKFVEVTADRSTRQFVSGGEISFMLDIKVDILTANATANFYGLGNKLTAGPVSTAMTGTKVAL